VDTKKPLSLSIRSWDGGGRMGASACDADPLRVSLLINQDKKGAAATNSL